MTISTKADDDLLQEAIDRARKRLVFAAPDGHGFVNYSVNLRA